jgi:hypothetical protein
LVDHTDSAFEQYPASEGYAQAYQAAKLTLDHNMLEFVYQYNKKVRKVSNRHKYDSGI